MEVNRIGESDDGEQVNRSGVGGAGSGMPCQILTVPGPNLSSWVNLDLCQ